MDLTEFLLARIAEDEAVAREAHYDGQRGWYSEEEAVERWSEICDCACPVKYGANRKIEAQHIANWDPARVLAECEAKRRIVEAIQYLAGLPEGMAMPDRESAMGLERAMQAMGAVYADHPDYDPSWRP